MITALDRKLWRDLRRLWAQGLAIALVMACGVMVLVLTTGAQRSLTETRDAYYERNRFADVFAALTRAPRSLLPAIAAMDGVLQVEGRVAFTAIVDLPGMVEPATARITSLPAAGDPVLNVPLVRAGRLPLPLADDEVAVSEPFAQANGLRPGDGMRVLLNGTYRTLRITGLVLSPEHIYSIGPGTIMPDDRRYGQIWMNEAAAAAARNLSGAFNELSLTLARGTDPAPVIDRLDRMLAPYGGTGAYDRTRQTSHVFLQSELDQLAAMAFILPPIFLIVAAVLVNMVLGRLIALDRPQIGLLKALGYSTGRVAFTYLKMAIAIGLVGLALGWAAGLWLGHQTTELYADFFRFPWLIYTPGVRSFAVSGALALATVVLGALRAVLASVRLPAAVAMQPAAPPLYSRGFLDAAGNRLRLRQTTMMILRSITRWPGRAAVTVCGVAASVAVLVASYFSFDAMNVLVDRAFHQSNRQHVTLTLAGPRPETVVEAARSLPGVLAAEGAYIVPVRLEHGNRTHLIGLRAAPREAVLTRTLDRDGIALPPPMVGVSMPQLLAEELDLSEGDRVTVELLSPPRITMSVPVGQLMAHSLGQDVSMPREELFARLRSVPLVNQINLLVDTAELDALHAAVKRTPTVAGVVLWSEARVQFDRTISENLLTMGLIYTLIGVLITIGVVYNAARIQLAERSYELASLRVLGFTRGEVSFVLVGETMLLTAVAVPLGWVAGFAFAAMTAEGLSSELVSIPLVVERRTYAMAGAIAAVAALGSVLLVRRRLDRVDLVTALKQKE